MKCDYTLSDLKLSCTKWLPCGEPVKITEYTETRILPIESLCFRFHIATDKGMNIQ